MKMGAVAKLEKDQTRSVYGPLLDAMEGIAYLADSDGTFLDWGRPNWNHFAVENEAPELVGATRLNVFDACAGETVAQSYRDIIARVLDGNGPESFVLRCDSASERRDLRMNISRVGLSNQSPELLFHVLPISKSIRPPVDLFDPATRKAVLGAESGKPLVRICAYCLKVHEERTETWIEAESYYQAGGSGNVRLSHGVCPQCYWAIVKRERLA
jgi:hypothetical protein